jgi:hypothetical protein
MHRAERQSKALPLCFAHRPNCVSLKRPGFDGGSNTGEWSHEEVLEVFA